VKIRFITKKALIRIAIMLLTLALLGAWCVATMFSMPGKSFTGAVPPLSAEEETVRAKLEIHLREIAEKIGERNCFLPHKLEAAAQYIEMELRAIGLTAGAEKGDHFEATNRELHQPVSCRNIAAEIPGSDPALPMVLVGAHYDSVVGSPGANDNGTGTVVLLEVARALAGKPPPRRTIRFVAFVNEEPPFFKTDVMGSRVHARACKTRGESIAAMISLETLGFYTSKPKTQKYPALLGSLYPDQGNFVGFVGSYQGRALVHEAIRVFRETTEFPSEGAATLAIIPGVDWSDHWSFWQEGYPALMVTDTAIFRYPEYHTRSDKIDQIDFRSLARVTAGISRLVAHLAAKADGPPR
jgi:hypothetical protein